MLPMPEVEIWNEFNGNLLQLAIQFCKEWRPKNGITQAEHNTYVQQYNEQ